ncbi:MAG TPA: hypothetical protein VLE47_01890 [Candidatus Saccharimonadales bacterium]|nr:hypothetical protein [Candidatus Saccharimonadales bacterium]
MKKLLLLPSLFSILLFSQTAVVLAESNNTGSSSREEKVQELKDKIEERLRETKAKFASQAALRQEKLEAVKEKVCETKKTNIVRRSTKLAERAENQINNFDQKATKVETYYTDKLVPKGITLDNYNDLVADVAAKKQAATDAVDAAKAAAQSFDCSGNDPKGQLNNFHTDMQNAIKAMKEFRVSIINLIVAVRTASGKTASSSATNQ